MLVVVPALTNILLATANQCCLFGCDYQPLANVTIAGMAVTYIRSTGEHLSILVGRISFLSSMSGMVVKLSIMLLWTVSFSQSTALL